MANLSVDDFKARLTGGGARSNLFQVTLTWPYGGPTEQAAFLCKATSLPGSTINPITIPFRGRQVHVTGDRVFEPWSITVINDANFTVRNAFERWMDRMNSHTVNAGEVDPRRYTANLYVDQLNKAGNITKSYTINGAWPSNLSAIDVSFDSADTIEEFTVEFQIAYWTSNTTT